MQSLAHRWILPEPIPTEESSRVSAEHCISEVVSSLLIRRGHADRAAAKRFLAPRLSDLASPASLKGFDAAVTRVVLAVERREVVALYGDYDADGVTAIALLARFLREVGVEPRVFIPRRFKEGYGLNRDAVGRLAADGATLLVSADCGISNAEEVAFAHERGVDVIVLDHHHVPPEIPAAVAVVNPLQAGCGFPYKGLSSVGLALMLAIGVRARLREAGRFAGREEMSLRPYLALVAIGTIADLSPLDGENRTLVSVGLQVLAETRFPGLRALCRVARLDGLAESGVVDARDVAFKLAPRLNAAGRLDDAAVSFRLLATDDPREAEQLAEILDRANTERQAIEGKMVEEAVAAATDEVGRGRSALVLWREGWHAGVVGIVAARVLERFYRPAFVAALAPGDAIARGSVRSVRGIHAAEALAACDDLLISHGGHTAAAGFSAHRERLPELSERLETVVRAAATDGTFERTLRIDGELPIDRVTAPLVSEISRLRPFGFGNPEPCFVARGVEVVSASVSEWGHQNLVLRQRGVTVRATGFRMGEPNVRAGDRVDVVYAVRSTREIRLRDLPRASAG